MIVADLRLRVMLLTHLVSHLAEGTECGESGPRGSGGVSELARLTCEELVQLARTGLPRVEVHLDSSGIEHGLRTMHDIRIRAEQLHYFIVHGATSAMLTHLFKLSAADVKARRRLLSATRKLRRPRMPPAGGREEIQRFWWELRKGVRTAPSVDDFMTLHRRFSDFNFATLYAVVNEFEERRQLGRRRRKSRVAMS